MEYLLTLTVIFCLGSAHHVRYDNYQVFQVIPNTEKQLNTLRDLQNTRDSYSFWTDVTFLNKPVDIMVAPHLRAEFQEIALSLNLTPELKIENIQTLIDEETASNRKSWSTTFDWKKYQTLEEIYEWLGSLEQQYPDKVKLLKGGETYEGRDILGIKITFKSGNKGVFLEGGIHSREWISPATVTYMANELLVSNDSAVRKVAESRDWYVFPVVNPDGYVYSHTTDRGWRKNRKPVIGSCIGTDLNRNWGYHWHHGGPTAILCLENFAGRSAFSEIETKSLSNFINSIGFNLDSYLAFHSFGQFLLIPYGHRGLEVPENNEELHTIGKNAAKALAKRYGTQYTVGNLPEVLYAASGLSTDWAMGTHRNIRIGYTYELRGPFNYFLLPPEDIIPTGEETLDSLVSIFQQADAQ